MKKSRITGNAQPHDRQDAGVRHTLVVSSRGTHLRTEVVPPAAAIGSDRTRSPTRRIACGRLLIVPFVVSFPAPLRYVAVHVEEAPGVGLLRADGVSHVS